MQILLIENLLIDKYTFFNFKYCMVTFFSET